MTHVENEQNTKDSKPFKIEAGKYYRTRDGRKVGPMRERDIPSVFCWIAEVLDGKTGDLSWKSDGTWLVYHEPADLVAEWPDPLIAPVAQQEEHPNSSRADAGSSPAGGTKPVYRVGDEVTVRVVDVHGDGRPMIDVVRCGRGPALVPQETITHHVCAPRPIEVGCRVKWVAGPQADFEGGEGKVLAIDGDEAWVLVDGEDVRSGIWLRHLNRIN